MGWFAFALALMVLAYGWWRVWRSWIRPCRELEQILDLDYRGEPK